MPIGKMRHRIQIQQIARVADGMGGNAHNYSTVLRTLWAMVEPQTGNERVEGGQIENRQRYKFTVRYDSVISTVDRVYYDSKPYRILSIQTKFDINKYSVIIAEQGVAT